MMRWTTIFSVSLLALALAAQPAQAVVIDLSIIDNRGNPLPDCTITFNWPNGQTMSLNTDSTGRLKGDVPKGDSFCSLWSGGLHLASGICNLTDLPATNGDKGGQVERSGDNQTSRQASSISPPPTAAEKAAAKAVEKAESMTIERRIEIAQGRVLRGGSGAPAADHMIMLSGVETGSAEFGVVVAQLFGLDGSGGDGGAGGGGGD